MNAQTTIMTMPTHGSAMTNSANIQKPSETWFLSFPFAMCVNYEALFAASLQSPMTIQRISFPTSQTARGNGSVSASHFQCDWLPKPALLPCRYRDACLEIRHVRGVTRAEWTL